MSDGPVVAIYALDVGQGDCTFVLGADPADGAILFDCNDPYVAERFVIDHGIQTLHAVVVSHLDRDHIHGLVPFLRWFLDAGRTLKRVYVGWDRDRTKLGRAACELLEFLFARKTAHGFELLAPNRENTPKTVLEAKGWEASILLPRYDAMLEQWLDQDDEPNLCSVALRVTCGKSAVLVGGDVPLASWEKAEPNLLPAKALRAPHHGGGIRDGSPTWKEADLYEQVAPELVVISAGSNNQHGHPTDEHLLGIAPEKRRLACTQITPKCHADIASLRSEALRRASRVAYAPYRHRRLAGTTAPARPRNEVPCASSVVIELFEDGRVTCDPERGGWHDRMIDDLRIVGARCRS